MAEFLPSIILIFGCCFCASLIREWLEEIEDDIPVDILRFIVRVVYLTFLTSVFIMFIREIIKSFFNFDNLVLYVIAGSLLAMLGKDNILMIIMSIINKFIDLIGGKKE